MLLDASAVLALLLDEPGSDRIEPYLDDSVLLSVNCVEVVTQLTRRGLQRIHIDSALAPLALKVVPFTEEMAWLAGETRTQLPQGLGIADCCCLAAAAVTGAGVVTADTLWRDAARLFGVQIIAIR